MRPIVLKRYQTPPRCGVLEIGLDTQSDLGEKVRCMNHAVVRVQIEESGNKMEVCEEHFHLYDGHIDWHVRKKDDGK